MLNFQTISFPIDFSEASTQTAPYVAAMARKFRSQVVLIHALDLSPIAPSGPLLRPELATPFEQVMRERRESDLAEFAPSVFDQLTVSRIVEPGEAAGVITRYADRNEVGLIVLPTHGLGTFRWLLLGSITAKVLHDSACPILTTVHSETLPDANVGDIRTIVCGVDLCSEPARVIEAASELAASYGSVVRIVHAIPAPEGKPGSNIDQAFKRFLFDTAKQQIALCQKQVGSDWEVSILSGGISSVLRNIAVDCGANLVVIGRGHLQNRFGRLRTNVGAIIRRSPCPVLSV